MSKRQKYGYEGAGVVLDLIDAKAEAKHFSKYGKSIVPIGKNSEVYKGHSLMGNPTVTLRPRTSHFARMNKPQSELHNAVKGKEGIERAKAVRGYFEDHGHIPITLSGNMKGKIAPDEGDHPVLEKRGAIEKGTTGRLYKLNKEGQVKKGKVKQEYEY